MNKIIARNIGTSFLIKRKLDIGHYYGEKDKLGEIYDYNIFYQFLIVSENGEPYLGGMILLLDKKTRFCLVVASSPNFYEYHVKLFRIIILNQFHDTKIDLESYLRKKVNIEYGHFIQAIFLLLRSHPENVNAYFEFLDILIRLDDEKNIDKTIHELTYESFSSNEGTMEIFINGLEFHRLNPRIVSKITELEGILLEKGQSIDSIMENYQSILAERQIKDRHIRRRKLRNRYDKRRK